MIRRRHFAGFVTAGVFVTSLPAWAAQPPARRFTVGILAGSKPEDTGYFVESFEAAMRELGYEEGRNINYERRWARGEAERLPELAAELVRLRVDAILASSGIVVEAARSATATIPIVMALGWDFAGRGWIASLAKPGGNLTGLTGESSEHLNPKRLELLKQTVPAIARVGVLTEYYPIAPRIDAAARQLGLTLNAVSIRQADGVEKALAQFAHERPDALCDFGGVLTSLHRQRIAAFALAHRMPAMGKSREEAQAGYLLAYSSSFRDNFRRAAIYVDKILRGTPPGDLAIEEPTRYQLTLNAATARALGITVPSAVLLRADEVIE